VKRTQFVSYGEAGLIVTNKTAAGRAKSRRVVITVTN
jgi:outer membrane protein OmpA-like peptidoglycan-associated protein